MNTTLAQPTDRTSETPTFNGPLMPAAGVLRSLDESDRATLERLLTEAIEFVDHPALHEKHADVTLFGTDARLDAPGDTRFDAPKSVTKRRTSSAARLPALSTEQEQTLFLRINYARMRIHRIQQRHAGRRLTQAVACELIAWADWEQRTRERIVEWNMPLVLAMAKRTRLSGVDFNEMISEGNMALLRSVDKFDCGRGFKFSTYCCRAILKAFSRVAMRTSRYRSTFPVEFDPAIERSDYQETRRCEIEADCVDDLKVILARNMADLTDVERTVIIQRFALEAAVSDVPMPKTLEQVGEIIGVTKERVRQIQNKALRKIRVAMEENYLAA